MRLRKSLATQTVAGPSPSPAPVSRTDKALLTLALVAGIAVTAAGEWELARRVGIAQPVAPLLPVAIDVYVIAAVRSGQGRDIAASLLMMGGAQVATHLLTTGHTSASVALVAAVSLLAPLVIWRVHTLARIRTVPAIPETSKPSVNVSRAGTPPWKPAVIKAMPALPPTTVKATSAALPEVVTARVSEESAKATESPRKPTADQIVRALYDELGGRPSTRHIADALKRNGLPCSDGTARSVRLRVEAKEPELKTLSAA